MKVERLKPPPHAFTFGHVCKLRDVNGQSMKISDLPILTATYVETRNSEHLNLRNNQMVFNGFETYVTFMVLNILAISKSIPECKMHPVLFSNQYVCTQVFQT